MYWCFAILNKRLAELYFEEKKGKVVIQGHCYVGENEFDTKAEKRWVEKDTIKHQFSYRNGQYKNLQKRAPPKRGLFMVRCGLALNN